jgi:hypothetical protein
VGRNQPLSFLGLKKKTLKTSATTSAFNSIKTKRTLLTVSFQILSILNRTSRSCKCLKNILLVPFLSVRINLTSWYSAFGYLRAHRKRDQPINWLRWTICSGVNISFATTNPGRKRNYILLFWSSVSTTYRSYSNMKRILAKRWFGNS